VGRLQVRDRGPWKRITNVHATAVTEYRPLVFVNIPSDLDDAVVRTRSGLYVFSWLSGFMPKLRMPTFRDHSSIIPIIRTPVLVSLAINIPRSLY
jgi:hypothetical protein